MEPFIADSDFTLYVGDVLDVLVELPSESVHCVVTSPPYWGLRDYGTGGWEGGDPDCDPLAGPRFSTSTGLRDLSRHSVAVEQLAKGTPYRDLCGKCGARRADQQLGLEPTPELYVERMVEVFAQVRRVLRHDGTCWLNLGDSYAGTGYVREQRESDVRTATVGPARAMEQRRLGSVPGMKPKDLVGIPWRVAFALQEDGWYLRSDVVWSKPNPMPESVTDRPTKAHEYVFLLSRSTRYFFDQEAVREPIKPGTDGTMAGRNLAPGSEPERFQRRYAELKGANCRTVWEIATKPTPEAHFATFPEELPRRCIRAGTSERGVCPECGAPWTRVIEHGEDPTYLPMEERRPHGRQAPGSPMLKHTSYGPGRPRTDRGWLPSCEHDYPAVPATVLDPFMGSGTTAAVARALGRSSVGIELSPDYAELSARRTEQLSLFAPT